MIFGINQTHSMVNFFSAWNSLPCEHFLLYSMGHSFHILADILHAGMVKLK